MPDVTYSGIVMKVQQSLAEGSSSPDACLVLQAWSAAAIHNRRGWLGAGLWQADIS